MGKLIRVRWRQVLFSEMEFTEEEFRQHFSYLDGEPLENVVEMVSTFDFDMDREPTLEALLDEDHEVAETEMSAEIIEAGGN